MNKKKIMKIVQKKKYLQTMRKQFNQNLKI